MRSKQRFSTTICVWSCALLQFYEYLLVHGLSGVSDSARRYPERHAHTDAPLMVAWLKPGHPVHCPSVPDLNWPTGQAEEDMTVKQMKVSSWALKLNQAGSRRLQTDWQHHVMRAKNWIKWITVIKLIVNSQFRKYTCLSLKSCSSVNLPDPISVMRQ